MQTPYGKGETTENPHDGELGDAIENLLDPQSERGVESMRDVRPLEIHRVGPRHLEEVGDPRGVVASEQRRESGAQLKDPHRPIGDEVPGERAAERVGPDEGILGGRGPGRDSLRTGTDHVLEVVPERDLENCCDILPRITTICC